MRWPDRERRQRAETLRLLQPIRRLARHGLCLGSASCGISTLRLNGVGQTLRVVGLGEHLRLVPELLADEHEWYPRAQQVAREGVSEIPELSVPNARPLRLGKPTGLPSAMRLRCRNMSGLLGRWAELPHTARGEWGRSNASSAFPERGRLGA